MDYDEFSMFRENAEEVGLAWRGTPVVERRALAVSDGQRLSALVWGEGEAELVLVHGGAQNAHTWDTVALALGLKKPDNGPVAVSRHRPSARANRYYNLAAQLVNQRHYKRALSNLDRAVAADSNFSPSYSLRGQIRLAENDPLRACDSFATAAGLDEFAVTAWAGWGRALLRLGRADEAAPKLEAALALEESFTPALLDLATVRARSGDVAAAREMLDRYNDASD